MMQNREIRLQQSIKPAPVVSKVDLSTHEASTSSVGQNVTGIERIVSVKNNPYAHLRNDDKWLSKIQGIKADIILGQKVKEYEVREKERLEVCDRKKAKERAKSLLEEKEEENDNGHQSNDSECSTQTLSYVSKSLMRKQDADNMERLYPTSKRIYKRRLAVEDSELENIKLVKPSTVEQFNKQGALLSRSKHKRKYDDSEKNIMDRNGMTEKEKKAKQMKIWLDKNAAVSRKKCFMTPKIPHVQYFAQLKPFDNDTDRIEVWNQRIQCADVDLKFCRQALKTYLRRLICSKEEMDGLYLDHVNGVDPMQVWHAHTRYGMPCPHPDQKVLTEEHRETSFSQNTPYDLATSLRGVYRYQNISTEFDVEQLAIIDKYDPDWLDRVDPTVRVFHGWVIETIC